MEASKLNSNNSSSRFISVQALGFSREEKYKKENRKPINRKDNLERPKKEEGISIDQVWEHVKIDDRRKKLFEQRFKDKKMSLHAWKVLLFNFL